MYQRLEQATPDTVWAGYHTVEEDSIVPSGERVCDQALWTVW